MIDIQTLRAEGFSGQFYKLHFQRRGFLLFPPPDLSLLKTFSKTQQKKLGKVNVHFNMTSILKFPQFFKDVNFILVTDHLEMLYLPFLTKLLPEVGIIATSLLLQLGRISLESFHETLSDYDATSEQLSFFEEGEILDKYEEASDILLQNWRTIFTRQDIKNLLSRVTKVNYHQIFNTEKGVLLRAFPSGKNNGSCFWELKNIQTNHKVLLVNQLAQFNWKTCQSYNLQRLKQSQQEESYHQVIFTRKTLEAYSNAEESKMSEVIKKINVNANQGISTTVVLDDKSLSIDLIPRIALQPQGSVQGIILNSQSFHHFHNYVNSYVDYLSPYYKNQIFADPPDFPLLHYSKFSSKGRIAIGTLEQLAVKRKLPLKQVILQSHPFVRFISSYEHHLELEDKALVSNHVAHNIEAINLGSNFGASAVQQLMAALGKAKFHCFTPGKSQIDCLQIGRLYNLTTNQKVFFQMTVRNHTNRKFYSYTVKDNELQLSPFQDSYMQIPIQWPRLLQQQFAHKGIPVKHIDQSSISTESTKISISEEMQLCVDSGSVEEVLLIGPYLKSLGKKIELP